MRWALLAVVTVAVGLAAGCDAFIAGGRCEEPCNKVWGLEQCDVQIPGVSQGAMYDSCMEDCRTASRQLGELEGYDPWEQNTTGVAPELENRAQVKVWSECVIETPCEQLIEGYCAPL